MTEADEFPADEFPYEPTEAYRFLMSAPKQENGKVDIHLLIAEAETRGYCLCPKPLRQFINVEGFLCAWCKQRETRQSWEFWYRNIDE